jgi:SAM-dependent methyltransferase
MNTFTQEYFRDFSPSDVPHTVIAATVKEILGIVEKKLGKKAKDLIILDVGSGWGEYTFELEKYVKKVIAVEPYKKVYDISIKNKSLRKSKVEFHNLEIEKFNTKEKFDVVISLTTIEHMSNAELSFKKIFSLLKKGGVIYATAPNKWWLFESHYGLPALAWLPLPLANIYLRLAKMGNSYKDCSYSRSYFGMKKLFDKFPCDYYFHLPDEKSAYLGCGSNGFINGYIRSFGIKLIKKAPLFWYISKGFIIIAIKK